jgi:23S rRNA U2552 (ribose-2'-O)-methylase RlmE/FtsJ
MQCIDDDEEPETVISNSLSHYLYNIKTRLDAHENEWDIFKKYTNPYEYIHSIVPHKKKSISKYKPISRSYFKMLEMIAEFHLDTPASLVLRKTRTQEYKTHGGEDKPSLHPPSLHPPSLHRPQAELQQAELQQADKGANAPFETPPIQKSEMHPPSLHPTLQRINSIQEWIKTKRNELSSKTKNASMRTFHLAEGPGGFIEAICNKRNNPFDEYYGMTIILDEMDDNVPAWHKTSHFLSQHPNVNIEYGIDGTGNLLHIENFEHCVKKYGASMDLITADGGFDFSKDFNRQEISIANLLWGQVCYALCLQKQNGNFVLKLFDIFYEHTVHILYILASFYEEVNICKLKTSRVGNSEKYLVCRNFRYSSYTAFYPIIHESFLQIKQSSILPSGSGESSNPFWSSHNSIDIFAKETSYPPQPYVWRIMNCRIPRYFTKQIEDINAIFGQQQIENIHYTLSLIDKQPKQDRLDLLVKQNITKCTNWCIEHSILYNNLVTTNVFEKTAGRVASV